MWKAILYFSLASPSSGLAVAAPAQAANTSTESKGLKTTSRTRMRGSGQEQLKVRAQADAPNATQNVSLANRTAPAIAGHQVQVTQHNIKSADYAGNVEEYLYAKSISGVGMWGTGDDPAAKWTVSVDGNKVVKIENVKYPGTFVSMNKAEWDCVFMCDYEGYACSDDNAYGCYKPWKIYTPLHAEHSVMKDVDFPTGAVVMYNVEQKLYMKADAALSGGSEASSWGLWLFDPPLADSAIFGEKQLGS